MQRHTEGNPLFVTEVIRDLVQSGELTEEKVSGRSTWSVRIPEGVREVIGRRLDRLSERANEVFTVASVIGRDFTLDAIRELAEDTTEGQLLDVLDEALDARIIEELPDEDREKGFPEHFLLDSESCSHLRIIDLQWNRAVLQEASSQTPLCTSGYLVTTQQQFILRGGKETGIFPS